MCVVLLVLGALAGVISYIVLKYKVRISLAAITSLIALNVISRTTMPMMQ